MHLLRKHLPLIIGALAIIIFLMGLYYLKNPLGPKLRIGSHEISYEVAITNDEITRGLSGRESLPDDHGMLFVFDHKEQYTFWMHEMKFPLDFIWIDDTKVVDLTGNVPPPRGGEQPIVVHPDQPVNRVLEISAGTITRLGIQKGDPVTYLRK